MSPAVSVAGLAKRYGALEALAGVGFDVPAGQIFGLLGPNGAGKTTALECILGLRTPDAGSIRIGGLDLRSDPSQVKTMVGAQLQSAALQDKITPREALDLFGSFYANPCSTAELLARFHLEDKADARFATLSGGQRQRLFLALAIVNRPAVLVLDEPTAGLDPRSRNELRALIRELRAEGRTILLSTHDLQEAAELCDRIAIIDRGRIVAASPPDELIARSHRAVRLYVETAPPLERSAVETVAEVIAVDPLGAGWMLETRAPNRVLTELMHRIDVSGAELVEIELHRPSLEGVFLELTGRPWSMDDLPGGES